MTAYLVREVNLKLFLAGVPVANTDRERLLRKWYRVNTFRLLTVASAAVGSEYLLWRVSMPCSPDRQHMPEAANRRRTE